LRHHESTFSCRHSAVSIQKGLPGLEAMECPWSNDLSIASFEGSSVYVWTQQNRLFIQESTIFQKMEKYSGCTRRREFNLPECPDQNAFRPHFHIWEVGTPYGMG
jgi:hypothetical protein